MENIPHLALPIKTFITLGFYLFTIIYIVYSVIFYYHWQQYSMSKAASTATYIAYFSITLSLLILMGLSSLAL